MDKQISYEVVEQVLNLKREDQKKTSRYLLDRRQIDKMIEIAYFRGVSDVQDSETWDDVSKSQYD